MPPDIVHQIFKDFPPASFMRLMDSFREKKYTSKNFDKFAPLLADITFAIQDPRVIAVVEEITGIMEQLPESRLKTLQACPGEALERRTTTHAVAGKVAL